MRALRWVLVVGLLASGCGPKHVAPGPAGTVPSPSEKPSEPERPSVAPSGGQARPGYDKRVESLKGLDTSSLRGRRIVLDPGHGGRFPGSLGVNGLTEAEVNLGVALNLWGLLTDAGAVVEMTRTADTDFATLADSSLRGDLIARTLKANAFDPDVFVSIHHNADAGSRHDLNETQTYYKFSDPLASYDLGQAIHRHLVLNLGIGADRLLPGNYYVVRNAAGPAVLGESSYLTNPAVESRLALAAKQRLEAEAYFLGLVDYFRTGVPRIVATKLEPVPGDVDGSERPWLTAVSDLKPGTAVLTLDGAPVDSSHIERTASGSAWRLRVRPDSALTDGRHFVEWSVRAAGGNWSRARRDSFDIDLPIARVALTAAPSGLAAGQVIGLTVRALDRHGRAIADTVAARFTARVGAVVVDSLGHYASPGEARAYARVTGGSVAEFAAELLRPRTSTPVEAHVTLAPPSGVATASSGFVRTAAGLPVADARVVADSAAAMTNADGFFALASPAAPTAEAPGYVTASVTGGRIRLLPIGGGALLGHRIAIDPAGGGVDTTSMAPDTSAAYRTQAIEAAANLRVASLLAEDLVAAGAQVVLTRTKSDSLTAIDRLRVTEAFAAERVISLSHRGTGASAGHYFSSPGGKALAGRITSRLDGRGATKGARVVESAAYLIQQTAAVAVAVNTPSLPDDARAHEEAYAIYLALLEDFGGADALKLPVSVGRPNVPVTLDGRWTLVTGVDGRVTFDEIPAGAVVTVAAGGVSQRVTLPAKDVTLTLP